MIGYEHIVMCVYPHTPSYSTLSINEMFTLSSHHLLSVFCQEGFIQRFCQHVCHLLSCCNMVYSDCSLLYLLSEMMIFDVEMFCSWSHLGDFCYFNCSFIVFKYFAVNLAWFSTHLDAAFLYFFNQYHE
jgi:hypothetical protein